ncbi:MAG: hypothetical protein ACXWEG_08575 [Actinomycetota bacterium]
MASGRRLTMLVVALALVGAPAVALRAFCVGQSCADDGEVAASVPFCPLPADLRAQIEAGYREGRSPDVMATTASGVRLSDDAGVVWPRSPYDQAANEVPILFFGRGVNPGRLPDGIGVDRIAPTIARVIGYDRPHPEVRSGTPLADAVQADARPSLVVELVWRGVGAVAFNPAGLPWFGSHDLHDAWTFTGTTGSLSVDPAAILTTIGTGGLPSQHGITGSVLRDPRGRLVPAWSTAAPTSIIATLADDWDHATTQRARIGLVARSPSDRGLVGGTWYLDHDRDDLVTGSRDPVRTVMHLIDAGYGADPTTDILGVVLRGMAEGMDRATGRIVEAVMRRVPDATFVLTATGDASGGASGGGIARPDVAEAVDRTVGSPVVSRAVAGGLFLDQAVMAANDITSDDVVRAMDAMKAPDGTPLFADAYPGFAISFSRYC